MLYRTRSWLSQEAASWVEEGSKRQAWGEKWDTDEQRELEP